jgi:hypothetical protein
MISGGQRSDDRNEGTPAFVTRGTTAADLLSVLPGQAGSAGASSAAAVGLTVPDGRAPTIMVTNMLQRVIEEYLLGDLQSMATEIKPKEVGAVGYPMVMNVLSGSELLGGLTSDVKQAKRIETYWAGYMSKIDVRYGDLGEIASELARNGIAHSYLTHLGVMVARGDSPRHLTLWNGEVIFDCLELYADFRQSYEEHSRPYILDHLADAQCRLDALIQYDQVKASSLIQKLPPERFQDPLAPVSAPATTASDVSTGGSFATPLHPRPA